MRTLIAIIGVGVVFGASAHGISPTRVEAPSGSKLVAYQFKAINGNEPNVFAIECFKGGYGNPHPCNYAPRVLMMRPNSTRLFKVQIETTGDDLYLVCTRQEPKYESQMVVTRVCARFGVGVPASTVPNINRKHPTAAATKLSSRTR